MIVVREAKLKADKGLFLGFMPWYATYIGILPLVAQGIRMAAIIYPSVIL